MPIRIPLLFHFNQHVNEDARTASYACYRGLLRVLRAHPTLPINIHISGTLIHALEWLDPEPLQLIWEGLRAGQFELLGSMYAQNVAYASDDWDNARQIEMHLKVLHDTFGVTPVTFWNPERSWRQSLLPLIAGNGYRSTLVEDHILADARLAEPVVVTSQVGAHILTILYDDHLLRHMFNFGVWFGRPGQLQSYLLRRAEHPNAGRHCLTYAEDAEAMGLWGWQEGVVPNQTWHRLDQILSLFEALPEVEVIHLTNAPPSAGNLSPIPEGAAHWMNRSLQSPERPYHESGYEDYFDFNENSPKLAHFRTFYAEIREELKALKDKIDKKGKRYKAAKVLYDAALQNYLAHQYEFGCIGIGGEKYRGWKGAQSSWVLMRAAEWSMKPKAFVEVEDINHDQQDEVILSDGKNLLVLTAAGGRLLYWFDLSTGQQYVGNQMAVPRAPYESDAALPVFEPIPYTHWLPADARPQAFVPEAKLTAEAAPTRMAKFLPDWVWDGEREPFELLTREMREPGQRWPIPAQRRAFVDDITINGQMVDEPGTWLETTIEDDHVIFSRQLPSDVSLSKRYEFHDKELVVTYYWRNDADEPVQLSWQVLSELTPGYAKLLEKGRKVIKFIDDEEAVVVRNTASKEEIRITTEDELEEVTYQEALMALEVVVTFNLELPAGAEETRTLCLKRASVKKSKAHS